MHHRTVAYLGIEWQTQSKLNGSQPVETIVVSRVIPHSPAERAGVHTGDLFRAIDGCVVSARANLSDLIRSKAPGSVLILDLQRGEKRMTLRIALGERQVAAFKLRATSESGVAESR